MLLPIRTTGAARTHSFPASYVPLACHSFLMAGITAG